MTLLLLTQAQHYCIQATALSCARCSLRQPPCLWLLLQAQHDYLQGNYPVVREDAAQMCALQIQAEAGPTLADDLDVLDTLVEKFVVKQASCLAAAVCGRTWSEVLSAVSCQIGDGSGGQLAGTSIYTDRQHAGNKL